MHEASIAQGILDIALKELAGSGYSRVDSVIVRIGAASGVMAASLSFSFDAMKQGTALEGALLVIEEVPLTGSCEACGARFSTAEKYIFSCPECESSRLVITGGRELDVLELEVS